MRVSKLDDASAGKESRLKLAFRELMGARMLWASGGIAVLGLLAGLIFFNGQSPLPLQSQPDDQPMAATAMAPVATSPETTPVSEAVVAQPVDQPAVLTASACDPTALTAAASRRARRLTTENERYGEVMRQRRGAKQLLSALTGGTVAPPSAEEAAKHDRIVAGIDEEYQSALTAAGCQQ